MSKATILLGDTRQRLADIPDNTIQTCVTSPPYWGLRDYGTASWDGGDPACDHQGKPMATKANINRNCGTGNDIKNATAREFYKDICGKCGATRIDSQIGLEQTPDEYVEQMVAVFREVRRVLKDDGTLWLNLGDSYAGNNSRASNNGRAGFGTKREGVFTKTGEGLKDKDLVGIPWRVAFALQADGWWLRQDIIWHKPNPMPESVTDRCTKAHEYLFLLTKSAKYHFDHKAIAELSTSFNPKPSERQGPKNIIGNMSERGVTRTTEGLNLKSQSEKTKEFRNRRSVWTIATKPFRGAHFAVMPETLVEPCILAGSQPNDTILDPFTGSGTVACVALRHGRNFIGTELNPEYVNIAQQRITNDNPMFNEVETA